MMVELADPDRILAPPATSTKRTVKVLLGSRAVSPGTSMVMVFSVSPDEKLTTPIGKASALAKSLELKPRLGKTS